MPYITVMSPYENVCLVTETSGIAGDRSQWQKISQLLRTQPHSLDEFYTVTDALLASVLTRAGHHLDTALDNIWPQPQTKFLKLAKSGASKT